MCISYSSINLKWNKVKTRATILVDQKIKIALFSHLGSISALTFNFLRMLITFFFLFFHLFPTLSLFPSRFVVIVVYFGFFLILSHSFHFWWFLPVWKLYVCVWPGMSLITGRFHLWLTQQRSSFSDGELLNFSFCRPFLLGLSVSRERNPPGL